MNTIEELELPDWPPIAIGAAIFAIGVLMCLIGLCRMAVMACRWCWKWLRGKVSRIA